MVIEFPFTPKPEDIPKLLNILPSIEIPLDKADSNLIKSLGFSASSSNYLYGILKMLGFVDGSDNATDVWKKFREDEQRGRLLASQIKKTYSGLFEKLMSPYLEDDDTLYLFFKQKTKSSAKELTLILDTFRILCDFADFQDIMDDSGCDSIPVPNKEETKELQVKVDPNLQLNLQVHIDPNTPDDKIEIIFKNMRKYLLGKEN
jgi:hypothetical protein